MLMSRYQRRVRTRRIIVVTGASSGVGRAIVRELARPGVCLALIARGLEGLAAAAGEVEERGATALILPCDVADPEAVEAAARRIDETFGTIDVWINVAATSVLGAVHEISPREFERVTQVSYLGYVYGTLAALKRMRTRDRGRIIQVGSASGGRGLPLQSAGCAAKHAIYGFTESLRAELLQQRSSISLTTVQLPTMNTPHLEHCRSRLPHRARPRAPLYQPEIAAQAVAWACDHDRPEIVVGGSALTTRLASRLAPWLTTRLIARTGGPLVASPEPHAASEATSDDTTVVAADTSDGRTVRPDNLFEPVEGDPGAHGPFVAEAATRSVHLWASLHRGATALAVLITLLALSAAALTLAWVL